MKSLTFTVTVQGLPDHAKDYRVQGDVCAGSTELLRNGYPDGQVNVIVAPAASPKETSKGTADNATKKMQAFVKEHQKRAQKAMAS